MGKNVIALGIDPGIANTGIAIVESTGTSYALTYHATIETDCKEREAKRYRTIQASLANVIETHTPAVIAIERAFYNRNTKSHNGTAGVIAIALCEAERAGIASYLLTPQQVKACSGLGGKATKEAMLKIASRIFGKAFTPRENHIIDAAFAGIGGILQHRKN